MDSVSGILENSGKLKQILFGKSIFLMKNDGDDGVNAKQHFFSRYPGGRGLSRSHSYVGKYSTKFECIAIYGIFKGKKFLDDF